jgi:hypothetical protein
MRSPAPRSAGAVRGSFPCDRAADPPGWDRAQCRHRAKHGHRHTAPARGASRLPMPPPSPRRGFEGKGSLHAPSAAAQLAVTLRPVRQAWPGRCGLRRRSPQSGQLPGRRGVPAGQSVLSAVLRHAYRSSLPAQSGPRAVLPGRCFPPITMTLNVARSDPNVEDGPARRPGRSDEAAIHGAAGPAESEGKGNSRQMQRL